MAPGFRGQTEVMNDIMALEVGKTDRHSERIWVSAWVATACRFSSRRAAPTKACGTLDQRKDSRHKWKLSVPEAWNRDAAQLCLGIVLGVWGMQIQLQEVRTNLNIKHKYYRIERYKNW